MNELILNNTLLNEKCVPEGIIKKEKFTRSKCRGKHKVPLSFREDKASPNRKGISIYSKDLRDLKLIIS